MRFLNAATAVIALPLAAALLSACGGKTDAQAAALKPTLTVEVVSPRRESWPRAVGASGPIAPWQEASIGTELNGVRLDEVRVNVGDQVTRGQLLARYNADSLQADLARMDAQVAEAAAALEKARVDAENADRLASTGAFSQQDIHSIHTQAAVAEARLASAKAQRDSQALRVRYASVVAPDDGVISSRSATVGAVAAPGAELFRLIRRGRVEWRAEVRADALPQLKPGTRAVIHGLDGRPVAATLRQVAPSVNAETLNGIVYVDVPAGSGLAAGMFVSGEFELAPSDALALPESVLVFRNGNRYVMQLDTANRIHEVKVQTGRRRDKDVEIVDGIDASARLALAGGAFLNDGDLVTVAMPRTAAP